MFDLTAGVYFNFYNIDYVVEMIVFGMVMRQRQDKVACATATQATKWTTVLNTPLCECLATATHYFCPLDLGRTRNAYHTCLDLSPGKPFLPV